MIHWVIAALRESNGNVAVDTCREIGGLLAIGSIAQGRQRWRCTTRICGQTSLSSASSAHLLMTMVGTTPLFTLLLPFTGEVLVPHVVILSMLLLMCHVPCLLAWV